jgi:hypothetical protein
MALYIMVVFEERQPKLSLLMNHPSSSNPISSSLQAPYALLYWQFIVRFVETLSWEQENSICLD